MRKTMVMLDAGVAFLLHGSYYFAIPHQARRTVVIEGRDPKNIHHNFRAFIKAADRKPILARSAFLSRGIKAATVSRIMFPLRPTMPTPMVGPSATESCTKRAFRTVNYQTAD